MFDEELSTFRKTNQIQIKFLANHGTIREMFKIRIRIEIWDNLTRTSNMYTLEACDPVFPEEAAAPLNKIKTSCRAKCAPESLKFRIV